MRAKKVVKVCIWLGVMGGVALLGLRFAALPYAEGQLASALRAAGLPEAVVSRTGLGLHGLGYEIYPKAGEPAVVALTLNPTLSLLGRKLVISAAQVHLDANWQLPGLAASEGTEAAIKLIERPLALPNLEIELQKLEVNTPIGLLDAKGSMAGRVISANWSYIGFAGTLGVTGAGDGGYQLQLLASEGGAPFSLNLKGGVSEPQLSGQITLPKYAAGPVEASNITFVLNAASKTGYNLPYSLTATLAGKPLAINGTVDFLRQTAKGTATADVKLESVDAVGIKSSFEVSSLWPPVIKNGSTLQATAVQIGGLPLIGPRATFGFRNNKLNLQTASAGLFGGQVSLSPTEVALPLRRAVATANFEKLELAQVLMLAAVEGLGGDGTLSGSIPVTYDAGKLVLGEAQLKATGAGQIFYKPAVAPSFLAAGGSGEMLGQVFSDFQYSGLTVGLGGTLGDNLTLTARLEGRNPSFYNGHSVAFNLNLSGALESLLTQGLQSFQFSPEAIKQMAEEGARP